MALLEIPLRNDLGAYTLQVELEAVLYTLTVRYNSRMGRWVLDIGDVANNEILSGLILLAGVDLLERYVDERLPEGNLFLANWENEEVSPGRNDLGDKVFLLYNEAS